MKVIAWTERAVDNLAEVEEFISQDKPGAAKAVVRRIIQATERLSTFPWSGRVVPEINDPLYREIMVYSYRVGYRVLEDQIQILGIHHGARPLSTDDGEWELDE